MADAEIVGLVIYDSRLFNRGSHVARWAYSVAARFETAARLHAPVNKRPNKSPWYASYPVGALAESISTNAERIGPKHWQIAAYVDVPYAEFVISGTQGPITATSADYMTLPRNPSYPQGRRRFTVSGQAPNNFLSQAAATTARAHPSLRGLEDMLFQQW